LDGPDSREDIEEYIYERHWQIADETRSKMKAEQARRQREMGARLKGGDWQIIDETQSKMKAEQPSAARLCFRGAGERTFCGGLVPVSVHESTMKPLCG